ncbi:MAG: phosphatidate cytidylyltransferase [Caulobacteraceae bacterium]|nr:phosphatidate cytidylyltransferase [Caulobacteraceae bacterium]
MTSSRPPRRFDWKNLGIRAASATVLIPAVLAAIWFGGWGFLLMLSLAIALLAIEWGGMSAPKASGRIAVAVALGALIPVFLAYRREFPWAWGALAVAALAAAVTAGVLGVRRRDAAFGVVYIAAPCVALTWIRLMPNPISWTILVFAVTWSADISAFAVGNALKGPKLSPRYSPNKTWSGFFGGLGGAMMAAVATAIWSTAHLSVPGAVGIGLSGGLATMAGDLWESMLKRNFGVKDSGDLIPGHGGLLDRVDGLMFAVLAVAGARWVYQLGWAH